MLASEIAWSVCLAMCLHGFIIVVCGVVRRVGLSRMSERLWQAAADGHAAETRRLLRGGADVNWANPSPSKIGETPLIIATANGHSSVVRLLLAGGAVVDKLDKKGWTALMWAAWNGQSDAMQQLLEAGADKERTAKSGATPLMLASWNGHSIVMSVLLAAGARVDKPGEEGPTALMHAAFGCHIDSIQLLLGAGAPVNNATSDGTTALIIAASKDSDMSAKSMRLMLLAGACSKGSTLDGNTAAHVARRLDSVLLLLANGSDFSIRNKRGQTVWDCVALSGMPISPDQIGSLEAACILREVDLLRARLRDGALPVDNFRRLLELATSSFEPLPRLACEQTTALVHAATKLWSPSRHMLFGPAFRRKVFLLFTIRARLGNSMQLPILPTELWLHIIGFLDRSP